MVLLKLETGPGRGQFKTNYLRSERERDYKGSQEKEATVDYWERPSVTKQSQPLLIGYHNSLSHADTERLWWPSVQTLGTPIFAPWEFSHRGYCILECEHLKSILEPTVPD